MIQSAIKILEKKDFYGRMATGSTGFFYT